MTKIKPRILVIGSNMMDLITYYDCFPQSGETVEGLEFDLGFGGKGANQAVAAAKLGADVQMITNVGDDLFGNAVIANLVQYGINVDLVNRIPGASSGVAPIFVDQTGENRIFIVKGANDLLEPEQIRTEYFLHKDTLLLQMEIPLESVYRAISVAAEEGVRSILNPAPMNAQLDLERLKGLDYLVPNEVELATLARRPCDSLAEIERAAQSILITGIKWIVVTLGARGCYAVSRKGSLLVPAPKVEPLDTTGAGDAFIGSFAVFSHLQNDLAMALRDANLYAAHSTLKRGTQKSYLDLKDFDIEKNG